MKSYKDMLYEVVLQENRKFKEDEEDYIFKRRRDFELWLEMQLLNELSWRLKFKNKLYELGRTDQIIKSYAKGRILDVGCGFGNLCFILSEDPNSDVRGIETNRVWVDLTNRLVGRLDRPNLRFQHRDFLKQGVEGRFDTVIFSFMLHDMDEPIPYIKYALKVLNPEGQILISDLEITHQRLSGLEITDFQDLGRLWSHNRETRMVFFRILKKGSTRHFAKSSLHQN